MRSVGTIVKIWAALAAIWALLMVVLMASSPASAATNPDGYYLKNEQVFEQDVEGEGFFMVYQKVNTESLQLKNYLHGSGTMDGATLIYSNQTNVKGDVVDRNTLEDGYPTGCSHSCKLGDGHAENISLLEQNEMTYSPVAMAYGTGFYAENPIVFNSKLKERTEGKNYGGSCNGEAVSMVHQIEYASAFVKDVGVTLKNIDKWPPKDYYSLSPTKGSSLTKMKIEEEVTEGAVHIGQLMTKESEDCKSNNAWKNPLVEIDENYIGTFKIVKNMEICTSCSGDKPRADWLSCCIGGYNSMEDYDRRWGEEEIFDCTCRDVAWGDSWSDKSKEQPL
ncbi:MAG TPA: hypothetical protein PLZ42_03210 [Methanothrix sp.]|nr:hypothetical protein [Methanothrix sp.]